MLSRHCVAAAKSLTLIKLDVALRSESCKTLVQNWYRSMQSAKAYLGYLKSSESNSFG